MSITQQQQQPQPKDAAAARKRRRRATAGGAADDCFSCSKKGHKCDRKRPYCTQCLEGGVECPGYKTQLTWGVGVASRGKLRGLSLPVAKSAPAGAVSQRKPPQRSRSGSSMLPSQWNGEDEASKGLNRPKPEPLSSELSTPTSTPFYGYDYLSLTQPDGSSPVAIQTQWNDVSFPNNVAVTESPTKLNAQLGALPVTPETRLSPPVDSTSDGYVSPIGPTYTQADEIPYVNSPTIMYDSGTNDSPISRSPLPIVMVDDRAPTSCPSLVYAASDRSSSYASQVDFDAHMSQKLIRECDNLSEFPSLFETEPGDLRPHSIRNPNAVMLQAFQNSIRTVPVMALQLARPGPPWMMTSFSLSLSRTKLSGLPFMSPVPSM